MSQEPQEVSWTTSETANIIEDLIAVRKLFAADFLKPHQSFDYQFEHMLKNMVEVHGFQEGFFQRFDRLNPPSPEVMKLMASFIVPNTMGKDEPHE